MKVESTQSSNLLEVIQNKLNTISKSLLYEVAIYFFVGFVIGLLLKYFGRVFAILIFVCACIWLLEFFGFININYSLVSNFLKISPHASLTDLISLASNWIKGRIAQCIALFIGIYLAWELM